MIELIVEKTCTWLSFKVFQITFSVLHFQGIFIYLFIYLSRGIRFSRASLNGALTKHKNKDIETLKLNNQLS